MTALFTTVGPYCKCTRKQNCAHISTVRKEMSSDANKSVMNAQLTIDIIAPV